MEGGRSDASSPFCAYDRTGEGKGLFYTVLLVNQVWARLKEDEDICTEHSPEISLRDRLYVLLLQYCRVL